MVGGCFYLARIPEPTNLLPIIHYPVDGVGTWCPDEDTESLFVEAEDPEGNTLELQFYLRQDHPEIDAVVSAFQGGQEIFKEASILIGEPSLVPVDIIEAIVRDGDGGQTTVRWELSCD